MKRTAMCTILILFAGVAIGARSAACPTIQILTSNEMARAGGVVGFFAEVGGVASLAGLKYEWTVTDNLRIVSGQGTESLGVRRQDDDAGTATVGITGLPAGCESHASESTVPIDPPFARLVNRIGQLPPGDFELAIDNFYTELQKEPDSKGLVVIQRGTGTRKRAGEILKYASFLKKDLSRFTFVFTSEPGDTIFFWLIPAGSDDPVYKDTVYIKPNDLPEMEKIFKPAKIVPKHKN